MKNKIVVLIAVLCIFVLFVLSTYIVDEREFIILTQFGKVVKIIEKPGLYFKLPFFLETVIRFDKRVQIFKSQTIQLLLKDKNPLVLTCYACWKVENPLLFFQSLIDQNIANQKINDMILSSLGSILGDYNLENIINLDVEKIKTEEIETKVLESCNQKSKEKYGIEIKAFGIQRINYPSIVADSIYERMSAEREKEAAKYRAEGLSEFVKIQADTNKEVSRIEAEAYKKAEIIKGEGDKKAEKNYADAYSKDQEFMDFLKSLNTYEEILKEKTTLILSTESDIFKYLNNNGKKK